MAKINLLTLRETPTYRVSTNPAVCTTPELLAAVIGGSRQFETAENLLSHFGGDLRRMYNAQPDEFASVPGVGHRQQPESRRRSR